MNKIIKLDERLRVGDRTVLRGYSFSGGETVKVVKRLPNGEALVRSLSWWEEIKGESLT
jgi:hypothetical protein